MLGAYRLGLREPSIGCQIGSQYTVWCWVLIDAFLLAVVLAIRLNTPCGAGCLSTGYAVVILPDGEVSIHRVVLGAYRRGRSRTQRVGVLGLNTPCGAGCLSTRTVYRSIALFVESQYTVWCWVLIDGLMIWLQNATDMVSIHRVVLGTYRLYNLYYDPTRVQVSQYTVWCWVLIDVVKEIEEKLASFVSIHRVVLGAYRRKECRELSRNRQVSIHRVVLGAYRPKLGPL